jgi:hypothetical protein
MFTKEEIEKFIRETEQGKKFNGIPTTKDNFEEIDFSKVDDPKNEKPKMTKPTTKVKLLKKKK